MADDNSHAEQTKYLIELLRLLWITLLATGSGTLGLVLADMSVRTAVFAALGCGTSCFLIAAAIAVDSRIRDLLYEEGVQ